MVIARAIVLILVINALTACEFIPGTSAYQEAKARQAAAQALIDPLSAQFRNVDARGEVVCGEVNGKNRLGAYAGFVRFYVETSNWNAVLDPRFNPEDLDLERRLCISGSSSSTSCQRLTEELLKQSNQIGFDAFWDSHCAATSVPTTQLPFDPTTSNGEATNDQGSLSNLGDLPLTNSGGDAGLWFTPPDDQPLVDQDGNPLGATQGNLSQPDLAHRSSELDQTWLNATINQAQPPRQSDKPEPD
jgi:hypothetical protein